MIYAFEEVTVFNIKILVVNDIVDFIPIFFIKLFRCFSGRTGGWAVKRQQLVSEQMNKRIRLNKVSRSLFHFLAWPLRKRQQL